MLRADHSSREVLPSVLCLSVYLETWTMKRCRTTMAVKPCKKVSFLLQIIFNYLDNLFIYIKLKVLRTFKLRGI